MKTLKWAVVLAVVAAMGFAGGVFAAEVFPFQPMLMGPWPAEAATVPSDA